MGACRPPPLRRRIATRGGALSGSTVRSDRCSTSLHLGLLAWRPPWEAGTHPKLVQTRAGHSAIKLTLDVYGKLAGEMALAEDQTARFNALATKALPAPA